MLNRKLVFWGIGNKGIEIINAYKSIIPELIIDNGYSGNSYKEIPVVREADICNWKDYFVVVCVVNNQSIISSLTEKGLIEGEDFSTYLDYFCIKNLSLKESLIEIEENVKKGDNLINKKWINYSFFPYDSREEIIDSYFQHYFEHVDKDNLLAVFWQDYLTDSLFKEKKGYNALRLSPASFIDNCNYKRYSKHYDINVFDDGELDNYIIDVALRRANNPSKELLDALKQIYVYYDKCFQLLKPTGIIMWGYWRYTYYFFRDLARKHNVPIRFAEWGLLPGTMLMEPCGRFHDSEISYSNLSLPSKKELETFYSAKKYLTDNRLDSMQSVVDADDENKLKRIKNDRRKVLLIGMCDDDICYNDSEDSYYRRHISSVVKGSIDAFFLLKEICVKNEWNLIFKPHPADEYDSRLLFDYEEGMAIVFHKNLNELITMADVCVAIDSSMNYRVLLYDKPLVQIGHNTMDNEDFIYMVNSRDDVERKLIEALDKGFNEKMKEKCAVFMTRMMKSVLWDDLSDKSVRYGLSKNIDFFDSSLGEGEWI